MSENGPQSAIDRDDGLAPPSALTRGDGDGVLADVRPRKSKQVTEPQAVMGGEIDRVGGLSPNNLGSIATI